jgi:hypothetical protein
MGLQVEIVLAHELQWQDIINIVIDFLLQCFDDSGRTGEVSKYIQASHGVV